MNAHSQLLQTAPRTLQVTEDWQQKASIAYPIMIILAIVLAARFNLGPTGLHDSLAIYWVWADQFTAELAKGNLYPRWMPASNSGLGAPVFYFYPPLAFYLTALFGLGGLSTYASLIACFASAFAASGIACWHWLKGRSNHPLLAALFFMTAPYHLFNYTERGALAESVAIAFIPMLAIGLRRVAERRGGLAATALSYAALICTHLPLALMTTVFLIVPYTLAHRGRIANFATAVAAGIGLAAIYLVPALALQQYHDVQQLYRAPNLRTDYWSVFSRNWHDVTYALAFLIIGALLVASALLAVFRRRDPWAILAFIVTFIVSGAVPFVWSLPLLRDVQYPFRALPVAEFALATAIARLPVRTPPVPALIPAAVPLVASLMVLPGFHSRQPVDLKGLTTFHPDTYEYLPKGVMKPGQASTTLREILASRVPPPGVSGRIVEPHFYFPAWSCSTVEPRTQLVMHEPSCSPRIIWTAPEKLGAGISLLTALLLAAFTLGLRDGYRARRLACGFEQLRG